MTNNYSIEADVVGDALESVFLKNNDIVDNLTTNDATKPLSAKQGKILKDMIDGIEEDMLS